MKQQTLCVLGSTGSIGVSTLDVLARHPDRFRVVALTAHRDVEGLTRQCLRFRPDCAAMADPAARAMTVRSLAGGFLLQNRDAGRITATLRSAAGETTVASDLTIAADGAGSVVRRQLAEAGVLTAREELLDHGYKELTIPATRDGSFALDPNGLHIWPRGGFMLIALPNLDRSFTATLFLPHRGRPGFDSLGDERIGAFFERHFPDAAERMPDLSDEFAARPVGVLGTVHCDPWSLTRTTDRARTVLLIGDAAHAIVPFHGQGMNAAFEDCSELAGLLADIGPDGERVADAFAAARKDNADAIAEMALENYDEMRDSVRDERFGQRAELAFRLERRFPGRFVPRYSMVMFHPEIGYADAEARGRKQAELLTEAMQEPDLQQELTRAVERVEERL